MCHCVQYILTQNYQTQLSCASYYIPVYRDKLLVTNTDKYVSIPLTTTMEDKCFPSIINSCTRNMLLRAWLKATIHHKNFNYIIYPIFCYVLFDDSLFGYKTTTFVRINTFSFSSSVFLYWLNVCVRIR